MKRFGQGTVLPAPPPVAQRLARLPDGALDPDADSDCGEACLASILSVASGYLLSPGCVRDALGLRGGSGVTTAGQLDAFLAGMGVPSSVLEMTPEGAIRFLRRLRHYGRYSIMLGDWIADGVAHWVVAYEKTSDGLWVMDPWRGAHVLFSDELIANRYAGVMVVSRLWS